MIILMSLTMGLSLLFEPVFAEEQHLHGRSEGVQLQLNSDKRWETDAPLRAGMIGIRDALEPRLPAIRKNKLTNPQYAELSTKITTNVNSIFKSCKLSPKADAQLHLILVQIMDGASTMKTAKGTGERQKGAEKIVAALKQYPIYFDHADWIALEH